MNARAFLKLLLAFGGIVTAVGLAQNTQPQVAPAQSLPKVVPGAAAGITLIEGGGRGRGGFPLPAMPAVYDTLQQSIRVSVVTRGLDRPWSFIVLPDGDMLVSFRYTHELKAIHKGILEPKPMAGMPEMRGLFDIAAHPKFAENKLIYFGYTRAAGNVDDARRSVMVIAKGRYEGNALSNVQDIFVTDPVFGGGSRMAFAPDGTLYMTISGALGRTSGWDPRKTDTDFGKVIRIRDDGTIPPDNPFAGKAGARPEIFTVGHRDQFGLAAHPVTGQMFQVELGPYGGDKVNVLKAGGDYGWPDYSYGRQNDSTPIPDPHVPGIEQALLVWLPGITPSGIMFYTGDKFPAWKGNMMVGSTIRGRVNGASGVERVVFNDKMWETRRETILPELKQRIRDIRPGPDGLIYVLTEEVDGAVLRVEPAN
jgi:glucose/arabinose dehydrogenase